MKKIIKIISIAALLILTPIAVIAIILITPKLNPRTQVYGNEDGTQKLDSISAIEQVELGGLKQYILLNSYNTNKPLVLYLHGGPGTPTMMYHNVLQGGVHLDSISVHWDQAGAGKSYLETLPTERINLRQYVDDAHELTLYLKKRFNKEKIYLVGFDTGTILGAYLVKEHPEDYYAFISIGQVSDLDKQKLLQDEFIISKLKELKKDSDVEKFEKDKENLRDNYLFQLNAVLKKSKDNSTLFASAFSGPEYTIFDLINVPKGEQLVRKNIKYNIDTGKPLNDVTVFSVPVYFFTSKLDFVSPYSAVEEYYNKITAPKKEIVLFENSAHYPFIEEKDKFVVELFKIVK